MNVSNLEMAMIASLQKDCGHIHTSSDHIKCFVMEIQHLSRNVAFHLDFTSLKCKMRKNTLGQTNW